MSEFIAPFLFAFEVRSGFQVLKFWTLNLTELTVSLGGPGQGSWGVEQTARSCTLIGKGLEHQGEELKFFLWAAENTYKQMIKKKLYPHFLLQSHIC
jgi:hypothetical protein